MMPQSNTSSSSDQTPFPTPTPNVSSLTLPSKPTASIHYTYYPPSRSSSRRPNPFSNTLIVFLNGLLMPRSSWDATIRLFLHTRQTTQLPSPALLSYDRYGQGDSDPDPDGEHDLLAATQSLYDILHQISATYHRNANSLQKLPALIFVGNSIGCALARLFAQTYPRTVWGLLFLDSTMANSDFVSFWPDPDDPNFDSHILPSGVSQEDLRATRAAYRETFHPTAPNPEGLSRANLPALLPSASRPKLIGYRGGSPYLTIAAHDWETFAEKSYESRLKTPKLLTMTYLNPVWRRYNEGLRGITDEDKVIGPITAVGCGHFVQVDGPEFVSDEMVSLLDRIVNRVEQLKEY
jgi:pimeloyl-ACP methyl ester carboxylesterase